MQPIITDFSTANGGHGVKVGPGPRDPPQSLKVGPGTPLKFKSGTPGPPSKFKSGTPSPFFNEFILFRIFNVFIFVDTNKIYTKKINCQH